MFRHILVPTDGSAGADIAIQSSMRFAKSIGAKVTGLHVVAPSASAPPPEADDCLLVVQHSARQHSVPCDVAVARSADVPQAIFQAAFDRQCDLIAMASYGRKDARELTLGHDTQEVLARSQIPVLVFR
ncbi:universal stress protein [Massilia sp. TSP1-1-2]|uniref:universal stress protein n=1 Tax=unclassified Massilia TaxID=2609279 RepID=UPI003CE8A19F